MSTKKWIKKKNRYGWVTQKRVTYSCPDGLPSSDSNKQQTNNDPSLSSDIKQGGAITSINSSGQVDKQEYGPD